MLDELVPNALHEFAESISGLDEPQMTQRDRCSETNYALSKMLRLARTMYPTVMVENVSNDAGDDFESNPPVFGGLVPLLRATAPQMLEPLLRKSTLYARHTSFVTPHKVKLDGLLDGSGDEVSTLLQLNHSMLPLLRAGRCSILPRKFELTYESETTYLNSTTKAPMRQAGREARFAPLNRGAGFGLSKSDELLLVREFVLPYYPNVESEKLAQVVSEETDSFEVFMAWFTRRVREVASNPEAEDLRDVLSEIDDGVARLRIEAENLKRSSRLLSGATLSGFSVTLGAVVSSAVGVPAGAAAAVAGITGAASLADVMRDAASRRRDAGPLRTDTFFVPYLSGLGAIRRED